MSQESSENFKTTPLINIHRELGGKLVPFAGWFMPIQYEGLVKEHLCVREHVGIFDVSHMGEIDVRGDGSKQFLQKILTNDIERMTEGAVLYSLMCYEDGGVVDDLLVYKFSADHYFLCVNASNTDKDFQWIQQHSRSFNVEVKNISAQTAQLAIQGKHSEAVMQSFCDVPLNRLKYYHFVKGKIYNYEGIISRTGYTGEDGFEVYIDSDCAETVFRKILKEGKSFGIQPIGLGARDTLRLEMGYALYGNEIDAKTSPLEAGLGWVVKLDKGDFFGRQALDKQNKNGLERNLIGIRLLERGVPRSHFKVVRDNREIGEITSGTFSPSLNTGIGLCYVSKDYSEAGTRVEIEIRKQKVSAEVVRPPFVPSRVKK